MPKTLLVILLAVGLGLILLKPKPAVRPITNFEECAAAGNPIMESYPERCAANGQIFTRDIGNEFEKSDLITVSTPRPGATVSSPFEVTGEARGTWYFEASFPIYLLDADGNEIAVGIAQAQGEWMTEDFVPFSATLNFEVAEDGKGTLVLKKDNPSGLPENDDELKIPVILSAQ